MNYNLAQLQSLTRQAGWPENQIAKAAAIWMYESNGNPNIINPGIAGYGAEYSVGLAQINTLAHKEYSVADLKNPIINLSEALKIWKGRPNYADWVLSNGKYNADKFGIASQSWAIYNNGGASSVVDVNSDGGLSLNDVGDVNNAVQGAPDYLLWASIAGTALLLLRG